MYYVPERFDVVIHRLRRLRMALAIASAFLACATTIGWSRPAAVGDPVPRIQCVGGYQATLYAANLASPDGLAFSPAGELYVAEEAAGWVSRVAANGSTTPVLTGLDNPEGIAFDTSGNLYVIEDIQNGRVVKMAPGGAQTTMTTNRDAPEGVAWLPDGMLYITESNAQFTSSVFEYRTRVTAIAGPGVVTPIRSHSPSAWSYSGITLGPAGLLYVANEASGTGTNESIFTVNPTTGARALLASGLLAVEGLRFAPGGVFPLYAVEENIGGGAGRLSRVEANGSHSPFCTGFFSIEDVIVDSNGRFYISEDGSDSIILISPSAGSRYPGYLPVINR